MSTRDITLQEQAREIHNLREGNQRLRTTIHLLDKAVEILTMERDNVILERDTAQAEAAEYLDQLKVIRENGEK